MKVRIGYGLGTRSDSNDQERFAALVDGLEDLGYDSLWLSERLGGDCPDPLVGMAYACGRTRRLKVGMSVMVLPGRNPVVLAKSIASLDRLSGGRVLPAFGLGVADSGEHQAFGVQKRDRGAWFNEALPLMRRLWSEDGVTHHGTRFQLEDVTVRPRPVQDPIEVWLGGRAPLEMKRVGRHADGWLPSFTTPEQAASDRVTVEAHAAEAGREIDPEHFGALVVYRTEDGPVTGRYRTIAETRNPDADPDDLFPTRAGLPDVLRRYVDEGFSKFVLVPAGEPDDWSEELERTAEIALPLQN